MYKQFFQISVYWYKYKYFWRHKRPEIRESNMSKETKEVTEEKLSKSDRNKLALEKTENADQIHSMNNGMFFWSREATLNMVTYKKSAETLRLKEQSKWNPLIRPIKDLSQLPKRAEVNRKGFINENFG